jgi:regulator of protease activity HflC (stomatin/prohibitin superfamily)
MIFSMTFLAGCGCEQVDTGYIGIETRFGEIQGKPLPPGLHFYNPFTSGIKEKEVREVKFEDKAVSFTRDTQRVDITFALTLYPQADKMDIIWKQFGDEWQKKLVPQAVQNAIKDVVGQYIADDLVGKRDEARTKAELEIQKNLSVNGIIATRLDFVNLDFDDAYEKAVEAKVVAVQKAAEAKNKTVEIEEKARQTVLSAEAEAKAMQIKSNALKENKSLVEFNAVEKWDGKLPQYMMGSTVPFIKLDGK